MPTYGPPAPAPWPAPPQPYPGCVRCGELDARRGIARDTCDRSLETDCNVLLRRHLREAHS